MSQLELKHIWNAPGYRELTLTLVDPVVGLEAGCALSESSGTRLRDRASLGFD